MLALGSEPVRWVSEGARGYLRLTIFPQRSDVSLLETLRTACASTKMI